MNMFIPKCAYCQKQISCEGEDLILIDFTKDGSALHFCSIECRKNFLLESSDGDSNGSGNNENN